MNVSRTCSNKTNISTGLTPKYGNIYYNIISLDVLTLCGAISISTGFIPVIPFFKEVMWLVRETFMSTI